MPTVRRQVSRLVRLSAVNGGGRSTGLQQLVMDTFWYFRSGLRHRGARDKSPAAEKPIDKDDFKSRTWPAASGCNFMGQEFGVYEASRAELHKWRHLTDIMQGSIPPRGCGSTTP